MWGKGTCPCSSPHPSKRKDGSVISTETSGPPFEYVQMELIINFEKYFRGGPYISSISFWGSKYFDVLGQGNENRGSKFFHDSLNSVEIKTVKYNNLIHHGQKSSTIFRIYFIFSNIS